MPKNDFACLTAKTSSAETFALIPCGDPRDFACAPAGNAAGDVVAFYRQAAAGGSLADRYFQSTLDGIESNLIYLTKAAYGESVLSEWGLQLTRMMAENRVRWALYLGSAGDTRGFPPPIFFDKHWDFFRSVDEISRDVDLEQLPAISIVVAGDAQSEQPGRRAGREWHPVRRERRREDRLLASVPSDDAGPRHLPDQRRLLRSRGAARGRARRPRHAARASGGLRTARAAAGARTIRAGQPRLARAARAVVGDKFLEWNWSAGQTGQLGHRDTIVSNIGSLLDGVETGTPVP